MPLYFSCIFLCKRWIKNRYEPFRPRVFWGQITVDCIASIVLKIYGGKRYGDKYFIGYRVFIRRHHKEGDRWDTAAALLTASNQGNHQWTNLLNLAMRFWRGELHVHQVL